jgi:hypothetical protein
MEREQSEGQLAEAVLAYLAEHPDAADTRVGIAEWWVARHDMRVESTTLQRVLDRLTELGVLDVIGDGENRCYRLKK